MTPHWKQVGQVLSKFPLKTLVVMVILSYIIVRSPPLEIRYGLGPETVKEAEFYPFSSFPMYSRFSSRPIYVYLSHPDGKPAASLTEFGILSSELKKFYDAELRKIKKATGVPLSKMTAEQKRPAGEATLEHVKSRGAGEAALRFHEVALTLNEDGEIKKTDIVVAEL